MMICHFCKLWKFKTSEVDIRENPLTYTAFMTLYYTGMRIGELTALKKADIDLIKGTITINKSKVRWQGYYNNT